MISVYLSNSNIQAVIGAGSAGRMRIDRVYEHTVPEGNLINGVITNEAGLRAELDAFWKENRLPKSDVTLVINSSETIQKLVSLPVTKEKQILELLPAEFADADRGGEPIFDYMLRGDRPSKISEVMAVMADRSFIESYEKLFSSFGVKISSVTTALCSAVKLLTFLPELRDETAVVVLLDGNTMMSLLLVDGQYTYSQRTRLFSVPGTDAFGQELVGSVNSMRQFYSTARHETPLRTVIIAGASDEEFEIYRAGIAQLDMGAEKLCGRNVKISDGELCDCAYAAGAFAGAKRDLNLYARYKKSAVEQKRENQGPSRLFPIVAAAVLCLGVSALLMWQNSLLSAKLDQLNAYISSPDVLTRLAEADELTAELEWMEASVGALSAAEEAINSYPLMNSKVRKEVDSCSNGTVQLSATEYYAENGRLLMRATSAEADEINRFIERLKGTGLFEQVMYSGYNFDAGAGLYNINVACYLSESAGK